MGRAETPIVLIKVQVLFSIIEILEKSDNLSINQ